MTRKTLLLLPALLFASLYSQLTLAHHWLLGIEGGYASRASTLYSTYNTAIAAGGFTVGQLYVTNAQHLSDDGFIYGVLGGYQWNIDNHWIFGIEGNIDGNNVDESKAFNVFNTSGSPLIASARYEREILLGLTARLGYRFHTQYLPFDVLPYVRTGGQYSSDELTVVLKNLSTPALTKTFQDDNGVFSWVVGAGLEIPLIDQLVLRGEYNYSRSERLEINDTAIPFIETHNFKPNTHTGKLQLVWNFC